MLRPVPYRAVSDFDEEEDEDEVDDTELDDLHALLDA